VRDHVLDHTHTSFEDQIVSQCLVEQEADHFIFMRRRDQFEKLQQFLLLVESSLDIGEMTDDSSVNSSMQLHILHCCICSVNLILKLCRLLVEVRND